MQQLKKLHTLVNPYFLYPFICWVIGGGILLALYTKEELFTFINSRHNALTDILMYRITFMGQGEVIVPVLLLLMAIMSFRNRWYLITATACNVIPLVIQRFLKGYFDAPRPLTYFNNAPWVHRSPIWPELFNYSFPSGHSQGAFSFFCFLSLVLPPYLRKFGFLFFLMGLLVCYSRVYLAAHFFEDTYAGSIIGTLITIIVYALMHKYKSRFFKEKGTFA